MELGMDSETFWNLCWYDLQLWIDKIIHNRKEKNEWREFHMELTRQVMCLIHNTSGKSFNQDRQPSDFMKLSYDKDETVKEERKPEEVLKKFPKKLHGE